MTKLTDAQRLAVLQEIRDLQARRLRWTPVYLVLASYEHEVRDRLAGRDVA